MYPRILDFRPVTMATFSMTLARQCLCPMVRHYYISIMTSDYHMCIFLPGSNPWQRPSGDQLEIRNQGRHRRHS